MHHRTRLMACLVLALSATTWAIQPPEKGTSSTLASKAFFKPELYLPLTNVPFRDAQPQLSAARVGAWTDFFTRNGKDFQVYLDSRTGAATGIMGVVPLIPGSGVRNDVTLSTVRQQLGRNVTKVDADVVGDLVLKFVNDNQAAIGVDVRQLGEPRVTQVTDQLWQVHIPQTVDGLAVRHGRLAATISHGNLILLGTEAWGNVNLSTRPVVTGEDAMVLGNEHLGLYESLSTLWMQPTLEIAPVARADSQRGDAFVGTFGVGYSHHLVWTYGFQNPGEAERWKVTVDAHTGDVMAVEDANHYFDATMKGGVYPSTNVEVCADNTTCGTLQPDSPMPWANTGLPAPNNFTDGAGVFNYTSGTATTTLAGKYVKVSDGCGPVSFSSSTGDLNLGGVNGNHDCVTGGGGAGNTASARSSFYELNKLAELARGWLPTNTWLQGQLTANVNINSTCNAFWDGSTVNFYRSGGGCRNTGEIGAVFDHEWGHGLDDWDANGSLSNSSEGYADIAAIYRLQTSCVGYGFFHTSDRGCGQTPDGTGFNQNEGQTGTPWCNTRCSGVRDADWEAHANKTPATPQNFTCPNCNSSTGPCGRQVHCAASPARQAAWDFVTRDLRAAPYNYDSNTAFIIGNKVFYQGSGNIGTWHACTCSAGTSDGCGATNGYMQWLAADDDNGNLADGTPHMKALYAAFNRHNIACNTPAPVNSGCASGPSTAPSATLAAGDGQVGLSWTSVSGASEYWVMKTEGFAGCDFSKAKVATVTGTSYTDGEVANGRQYCYSVVPASTSACYGPASSCSCATPTCSAPGLPALVSPAPGSSSVELAAVLDWSDSTGATTYQVEVATDDTFTNVVRTATGLNTSTWAISPALSASTTYYWRVRAANSCGGTSSWSSTGTFTTRACIALTPPSLLAPANGATGVGLTPALDWSNVNGSTSYEVQVASDSAFTNVVRSASNLSASAWTASPALSANTRYYWRARAADTCGAGAYSATSSFTTTNICTPLMATYNTTRKAPTCGVGCGCNTGTLINGRGTMTGGAETNQPNTVNGSCADGNSGTYHTDESIDKMVIKSVDEGLITTGKQVKVDVTVWCYSNADKLDLYYATNAATPTWTTLATDLGCTASGAKTFSHTFTVGNVTGQHAIRGQFRYQGTPGTCTTGGYNDRDDVVITVSAPLVQSTATKQTVEATPTRTLTR